MQKLWIASTIISTCLISNSFATVSHTLGAHPIIASKDSNSLDFTDLLKKHHASLVVRNAKTGAVSYTQEGQFYFDANGYVVQGNNRLQAYPIADKESACTFVDLKLPEDYLSPKPTTTLLDNINLNPGGAAPTVPLNPADSKSYNFRIDQTIYDSLGFSHHFAAYFVKSNTVNLWNVYPYVDDLPVGQGTLIFSTSGKFFEATGLTGISFNPGNGATSPQMIDLNLTAATTYAKPTNEAYYLMQDGRAVGTPDGFVIDEDGFFGMTYSNGELVNFYKLALFNS